VGLAVQGKAVIFFMERYKLNSKIHVIQVDAGVWRISESRVRSALQWKVYKSTKNSSYPLRSYCLQEIRLHIFFPQTFLMRSLQSVFEAGISTMFSKLTRESEIHGNSNFNRKKKQKQMFKV
jgi:hypothetical protein